MRKTKKFLCTLLAVVLCLTTMAIGSFANAASVVKSGKCGDNITWTLDSAGTLTLSGSGAMYDKNGNSTWEKDNVKKVIVGKGITTIGSLAFAGCFDVESLNLPDTLTEIKLGAFAGCNIKSLTIPSNVKNIGYGAFLDCESLKEVFIPASVEIIGQGVFNECESLEYITVDKNNKNFLSAEGVLYSADMKTLIKCPATLCGSSFLIPNTVEDIDECAFDYCKELVSINIPYGVKKLDYGVFEQCTKLSSVTIPSSVEIIGQFAFFDCLNLEEITIPMSVNTIGEYAFGYELNEAEDDVKKLSSFKIKGYTNSAAETYANDNGIEFISLGVHTHQWKHITVSATCAVKGYERDICSGCSAQANYREFPLKDHSFGAWNVISDETTATCTRIGTEMRKCSVCGKEETRSIPKTDHSFYDWEILKAPTCNSEGTEIRECSYCSKGETRTIPKLTHVFSDWTESKKATVLENGEMTRSCTLCGKRETKSVDKLPSTETKDEKTGISLIYSEDSFKGDVEIKAQEVVSGETYNIAVQETSCSRLQLFDISVELENEKVQPTKSVWVKVPLPSGYSESKTAVYFVGENGELEKMNSVVQDGYICFEATHFSPYAVVDESSNPNNCTCDCHKGGIKGFLFKILNFFQKLFGQNKVCACGVKH